LRKTLSNALVDLGKSDPNILLLTGDHGYALFDDFRRECPKQYINAGIAEQNMVGMAAGLARLGFRPIVYGLSAFIPIRVLEQIKIDIAHDRLPVIFIGDGAGFVYSHLGTSHQSIEDIACSRVIPNLSVYSPADRFELTQCLSSAYQDGSSIYLRIGKDGLGDVHHFPPKIKIGDLVKVNSASQSKYSFIATGSMVKTAIDISNNLPEAIDVWSAPFIKPIDNLMVEKILRDSEAVVTFEEHSKYGGLGSLVAEISAESLPRKILKVAANDRFSQRCGTYQYLLKEHKLDFSTIHKNVHNFLKGE